jgi:hypothetical protein
MTERHIEHAARLEAETGLSVDGEPLERDLTEKLGFTRHATANWTVSQPGWPDLTNTMLIEEVGEDWVTARPEGSDTLYTFGNHPQADVQDLSVLTLLPKGDA